MITELKSTDDFNKKIYDLENTAEDAELEFLGDRPAIVDFYAPWCGPCKILEQTLKNIEEEYEGKVDIYKVNTEDALEVASKFRVMSIPTILYIPTKGEPEMSPGAPDADQLKYMLNGLIEKSK